MIWPLRRLYKRFRYSANDIRRFSHAGIDLFEVEGETLRCFGWFFDRFHRDTSKRWVSIFDGDEEIFSFPAPEIRRFDIAKMLSIPDAVDSGFDFVIHVETDRTLEVRLWYESPDGRLSMPLGRVKPNVGPGNASGRPLIYVVNRSNVIALGCALQKDGTAIDLPESRVPVDIIIPVYNGFQYFDALFASVGRTNVKFRLIVIDDCSSDERIVPYLKNKLSQFPGHIFIQNESNLGFVSSVNAGLSVSEGDVVLLNTDVELPPEWLERLIAPIWLDRTVASVTPFTNSGTICSFPVFCEDNTLLPGLSVGEEDSLFRYYAPRYQDVPTGVGFCMAMSRRALDVVGKLDDIAFKRGYGEENDWCRRAVKSGFRNVHVTNLFVFHNHGGSFLSEEKQRLMRDNALRLLEKHPEYDLEVSRYCRLDPVQIYRLQALRDYITALDVPSVIFFSHNLGGGADYYLKGKREKILSQGFKIVQISYDRRNWFEVGLYFSEYYVAEQMRSYDKFVSLVHDIRAIIVNELVTFPNLFVELEKIQDLAKTKSADLIFMFHDYYAVCPSYNLISDRGEFCGVPLGEHCSRCLEGNAYANFEGVNSSININTYRDQWKQFFQSCSKIVFFSKSSIDLYSKAYPLTGSETLEPHSVELFPEVHRSVRKDNVLRIGVAGSIAFIKGENVIRQLVDRIEKSGREIEICIIGTADTLQERPCLRITGMYERNELPLKALWEYIDIFFIPSICPETFSFTTHEIISMGYPIAVFDLGAPADRVSSYSKGLVIQPKTPPEAILDQIVAFAEKVDSPKGKRLIKPVNAVVLSSKRGDEGALYENRILLAESGWRTEMISLDEIGMTKLSNYNYVVLDEGISEDFLIDLSRREDAPKIISLEEALYSARH